ncbi:MAG: hypothetical protein WBW31_03785, partial [Candidatus Sulfotelmatobacter sp.]
PKHESAHVDIAEQRADRGTLWGAPAFVPIARISLLPSSFIRFLDGGHQPQLDQMQHGSIDNPASYRLEKIGMRKSVVGRDRSCG